MEEDKILSGSLGFLGIWEDQCIVLREQGSTYPLGPHVLHVKWFYFLKTSKTFIICQLF